MRNTLPTHEHTIVRRRGWVQIKRAHTPQVFQRVGRKGCKAPRQTPMSTEPSNKCWLEPVHSVHSETNICQLPAMGVTGMTTQHHTARGDRGAVNRFGAVAVAYQWRWRGQLGKGKKPLFRRPGRRRGGLVASPHTLPTHPCPSSWPWCQRETSALLSLVTGRWLQRDSGV